MFKYHLIFSPFENWSMKLSWIFWQKCIHPNAFVENRMPPNLTLRNWFSQTNFYLPKRKWWTVHNNVAMAPLSWSFITWPATVEQTKAVWFKQKTILHLHVLVSMTMSTDYRYKKGRIKSCISLLSSTVCLYK